MYAELTRTKVCNRCGEEKDVSKFYVSSKSKKRGTISFRVLCRECERKRHAEYVDKNKERINRQRRENYHASDKVKWREASFKRKYGISLQQYDEMAKEQQGRCAICKTHQSKLKRNLDVDHCHGTGKIRGLLCSACNTVLGLINEKAKTALLIAEYLEKSKK